MPKFGTKNALLGIYGISYMKSAPSNLSNWKISGKKYLNSGPKMRYLGIFGLEF